MNDTPKLYGGNVPCMVYVPIDLYRVLEKSRGKVSKSSYIKEIIEKGLKQNGKGSSAC